MDNGTNLEIFKTKEHFNKWLKELTKSEKELIIEMMDEARESGYDKGWYDCANQESMQP